MEDFQNKFILALLAYAVKRDISAKQLCELSGINYKELTKKSTKKLTAENINALWKNAAHLSKDSLFGLHLGESMQLAALGVIGQIVQTSSTVGEALTNAGAFTPYITDMFQMQINHSKKSFTIHLLTDKKKAEQMPFTYRHMADYLMVFVIHEMDGLLLEKIEPLAVRFPYHIADPHEYTRVFRSASIKRSTELSLEFSNRYLAHPVLSANYELQNLLVQKISVLMKDTKEASGLQVKIYNYLLTNSYLSNFSQDTVGANFNISPRNLQRKLKDEGTSYQQIVESVRKTLAINYLSSGNYNTKDIASMLGYNEPSAFARAFKRWTNKTPLDYHNVD